jgi:hypothetical protein
VTVFPGDFGGIETPMAYAGGTVFAPVTNLSADYTSTSGPMNVDITTGTGELDAIDAATGTMLWSANLDAPDFGGAVVAGDLVFTSTFTGEVLAFDRSSGTQVWSWQAPDGINGFLSVAGDTVLVPVGMDDTPQLVALRPGATTAPVAPTAQPAPTAVPTITAPAPVAIQLSINSPAAPPLTFSTTTLTAAAGAQVTVTFANNSSIPHNWHVFNGTRPSCAVARRDAGQERARGC